jgi:hypothetical protein
MHNHGLKNVADQAQDLSAQEEVSAWVCNPRL